MKKLSKNELGFGAIEILLITLIVAVIGGIGYYVWHSRTSKNNSAVTTTNSTTPTTQLTTQTGNNTKSNTVSYSTILNGKVKYILPSTLKITSTTSKTLENACGQSATSSAKCLGIVILNPKNETFDNSDQFHISIGVFGSNGEKSVAYWYKTYLDASLGGKETFNNSTINGSPAIYDYADYSSYGAMEKASQEVRISYGILGDTYGVVVNAVLFKGAHYSFTNPSNIDYHKYQTDLESIAKSIMF